MSESVGPVREIIRASKEVSVDIKGEVYDVILVPRKPFVTVDFTDCPEDDPLRRERNVVTMTQVDLEPDVDLFHPDPDGGATALRLTEGGAERLLTSL